MTTANVTQPEIAVVDDNHIIRDGICEILARYGFKVSMVAVNGLQFIHALQTAEKLPDVCLIDLQMPVMNGYETIRKIREDWPALKVVACSTTAEPYKIDEAIKLGADLFYQKGSAPKIDRKSVV